MIVSLSRSVEDARWATEFLAASSDGIELGRLTYVNGCERTTLDYDIGEHTQQQK
jgi:hypothetical protein